MGNLKPTEYRMHSTETPQREVKVVYQSEGGNRIPWGLIYSHAGKEEADGRPSEVLGLTEGQKGWQVGQSEVVSRVGCSQGEVALLDGNIQGETFEVKAETKKK